MLAAAAPGQAALPPGLAVFAWLPAGFEADQDALAALRQLGVDGVLLGPQQDAGPARALGFAVLIDQLVGKGILELRDAQFTPLRDAYERDRTVSHLVRPGCLSDPATRAALVARADAGLPPLPVCGISLGDEVSTTRHANPLDFSFSPAALAAWRARLAARFPDVHALNGAWGTAYASFAAALPPTTDQARAELRARPGELPRNLAAWASHRSLMDEALAATVADLVAHVRGANPAPCGLTGIQQPSAFGGSDLSRLLPSLGFFEAYDIGGARDLAMCLAPTTAWQLVTLFPPAADAPPGQLAARIAEALAHGVRAAVAWHAGLLVERGEGGVQPTAYGRELTSALAQARPLQALAGARLERSPVWLLETHAAVQAHWMLDSAGDGDTWIRRLSSYEETHSTSLRTRHGWVRLLEDLGRQGRFVASRELAGRLGRERPRLIVLPAQIALDDDVTAALRRYVAEGGNLLADFAVGWYDGELRRRERPALDEVFGLEQRRVPGFAGLLVREGQPAPAARLATGAAAAERDVRAALAEQAGELHVQCEHRFGRGLAVYLNLAVCEYGAVRLDPARVRTARDLRRRVQRVLDAAGVPSPLELRGDGLPTCVERAILHAADGSSWVAVRLNALEGAAVAAELARRGPLAVEVFFAGEVALRIPGGGELGPARSFPLALDPAWGLFAELRAR